MSSRSGRRDRVWPPPHRRDLQRRSLPRTDPAPRCAPTWPLQRIRPAAAVGYLQRDVFIKRSGLDRIPAKVARRPHYAVPRSKRCRARHRVSQWTTTYFGGTVPDTLPVVSADERLVSWVMSMLKPIAKSKSTIAAGPIHMMRISLFSFFFVRADHRFLFFSGVRSVS
jgi:hypothetical protein